MFGLLSRKVKPPPELVRTTREALLQLEQSSSGSEQPAKVSEEVSRNLSSMKLLLYGEPDQRPNPEAASELAREVWKSDVLRLLLTHLPLLDFECRKDVSQVFSNLLRRQQHGEHETVKWLEENRDVLFILLRGYETPQLALNYGIMLRECARHERLATLLLPTVDEPQFYALFTYIESPYFDVASDAFASLKDLLTKHKPVVAAFLAQHYEPFFQHYHKLVCPAARPNTAPSGSARFSARAWRPLERRVALARGGRGWATACPAAASGARACEPPASKAADFRRRLFLTPAGSDNYVTKRQSLKLLGELLLDRTNFAIMTRYIACVDNLKMVMVLLRDRSSSIQLGQQGGQSGPLGTARARPPRLLGAAALGGSDASRVADAPRVRGRASAHPSHRLGCSSAPPISPIPPPSAVQVRGLPRLQDLRGQPAQGGPRAQRAAAQPAQAA